MASDGAAGPRKFLVAIDFSEASRAALSRALELARALGGRVALLHAVDTSPIFMGGMESFVDVAGIAARIRESAESSLKALADEVDADRRLVAEVEIFEGRPAQAVIDAARTLGADLIVMGTHGRTGVTRFFLGSVAERVVRTAPCDVLVVHPPAAKDEAAPGAPAGD